MTRRLSLFRCCLAGLLCTLGASAAEPSPSQGDPRDDAPPSSSERAVASGAAIVPGVIVHGAGHYVLGDSRTATKLLIAEGIGVGMVLGGGLGLFLTGASRHTVVPFATLSMYGVGVFSAALLADLYGSAAGDQSAAFRRGYGAPARFESELGYRYVTTPVFEYRNFMVQRLELWAFRTRFEPSAWLSFGGDNVRYRLEVAQRLYGASPGAPRRLADFVELELALTHHRYHPEYFQRTTVEAQTRGRWDLAHFAPSLRGAFVEGGLGYAVNVTSYDIPSVEVPSDGDDLLLASMAFGFMLRGPTAPGSELQVFYDHRHDGFAAGTIMPGLGSGVIGHAGLRGRLFFDERWGISGEAMTGSAVVAGLSLVMREGN